MSQASKNSSAVLSKAASGALGGISSALRRGFYRTPPPSIPLNAGAITSSPPPTYEPPHEVSGSASSYPSMYFPPIPRSFASSMYLPPPPSSSAASLHLLPIPEGSQTNYEKLSDAIDTIIDNIYSKQINAAEANHITTILYHTFENIFKVYQNLPFIYKTLQETLTDAINAMVTSKEYTTKKYTMPENVMFKNIITDYALGVTGPMSNFINTSSSDENETHVIQLLQDMQKEWIRIRPELKGGRRRLRSRRRRTNRRNTRRRR